MAKKTTSAAKLLGSKGGKASAAKLTKEQLSERGRKAISARWAKVPSWNWCHKCKQLVDVDGVSDGSEVKCWGCRRRFVVTYFENGEWALLPLASKYQCEARAKAKKDGK